MSGNTTYEPGVMEVNVANGLRCVPRTPKIKIDSAVSRLNPITEWKVQHRTELGWVDVPSYGYVVLFDSQLANQQSWALYHIYERESDPKWVLGALIKRFTDAPSFEETGPEIQHYVSLWDQDMRRGISCRQASGVPRPCPQPNVPLARVYCPVSRP